MKTQTLLIILIACSISLAVGCTRQPRRVDNFYGTSYELAKMSQIANPSAGIQTGPPVGLQGMVGEKVVERYVKSFEKPAAKTESYSIVVDGMTKKSM
jgi:hypothetical protein